MGDKLSVGVGAIAKRQAVKLSQGEEVILADISTHATLQ